MPKIAFDKIGRLLQTLPRATWKVIRASLPRAYAVSMILIIGWLTWRSVSYLVVSLLYPTEVPAQIADLPTRLDRESLRKEREAWKAVDATDSPRSPLAHYHRLDTWIEPDKFNDCTRGGCHAPLPHSRRKEVRAFLNMHATSMHCGVCHMETDREPLDLIWYDLAEGEPREAPSIIKAYDALTSEAALARLEEPDAALQKELVTLIRAAAEEAHSPRALRELAEHLAAVRPKSSAFAKLIVAARETLPKYFRGEYGAKLAIQDRATGKPLLGHPGTDADVERYLLNRSTLNDDERNELLKKIHPLKRTKPLTCSQCHRDENSLIPFARLGYPQTRVDSLVHQVVIKMIEHIDKGKPFQMPGFVGSRSGESATSQPASP
ncbi:MAG: hypothetical protein IPK83_22675 [Planctomycetes bacterium]|nr:hypothetical protein [Planctomycetota bacterium]